MKTLRLITIAAATSIFAFTACDKREIKSSTEGSGSFELRMTDAPGDYAGLDVEIESVEVYNENKGWITLSNESQFVNVLSLTNGTEKKLAIKSDAEAGVYSKVKLTFGERNELLVSSENEGQLGGASGSTLVNAELQFEGDKEVIIEINEEISSSSNASVLLDFNVAQSIKEDGEKYILEPSIRFIADALTGIQGEVQGSAHAAVIATNGSDSVSTYTDFNGQFLLRGMQEGEYDIFIFPSTEDQESGQAEEEKIEGVFIAQGEITVLGKITL